MLVRKLPTFNKGNFPKNNNQIKKILKKLSLKNNPKYNVVFSILVKQFRKCLFKRQLESLLKFKIFKIRKSVSSEDIFSVDSKLSKL